MKLSAYKGVILMPTLAGFLLLSDLSRPAWF